MKNMKKLVALFAATVMTMSLSLSAFAATVDTTVEGEGDNKSSFNLVFDVPTGATDADIDQLTMMAYLVDGDTVPENIPDYNGTQTIVAMDQVDGDAGFGLVPVDVEKLDDGYAIAVAIGGTDVAAANVYKALVTYDKATEAITITFKWGDVNADGYSDEGDYATVLNAAFGGTQTFVIQKDNVDYTFSWGSNDVTDSNGESYSFVGPKWGDVNADGYSDEGDYAAVLNAAFGGTQTFVGSDSTEYTWDNEATLELTKN